MISKVNQQKGFTILELIIATTVFGVMMLVATTGMIQIGRAYYKGVVVTRTQETSRSIVEEITRTVQFGGSEDIVQSDVLKNVESLDIEEGTKTRTAKAVCIGDQRYSYIVGRKLDPRTDAKHALWYDQKSSGAECEPVNLDAPQPTTEGRELLGNNMRLAKFEVTQNNQSRGANIVVKVIYGDFDLIQNIDDPNTSNCVSADAGGQFCAFSELSGFVTRRL